MSFFSSAPKSNRFYDIGISGKQHAEIIGLNLIHATLSDGPESDDLLGMMGSVSPGRMGDASTCIPNRISTILLQSMNKASYILLTHVLSQTLSPTELGGVASLEGRQSLVLVPTKETSATVITPDHPYFIDEQSRHERDNPFASQPSTVDMASQLLTMTLQHSPSIITNDDSLLLNNCRGLMTIVAPLMDIIVDGVDTSFMEGSHWRSSYALSKFLINSQSISTGRMAALKLCPSYHSATLVLDPQAVTREISVNADCEAMKLLCLDIPVQDMVIENSNAEDAHPYLPHVGTFLMSLCRENVPIRWFLEQESESTWFVINATLLQI